MFKETGFKVQLLPVEFLQQKTSVYRREITSILRYNPYL